MVCREVLVLSSANAIRPIMAEAYLNSVGRGVVRARSAGLRPLPALDAKVVENLRQAGLRVSSAAPKSLQEVLAAGPQRIDIAVWLGARETDEFDLVRRVLPGRPDLQHWPITVAEGLSATKTVRNADLLEALAEIRTYADSLVFDLADEAGLYAAVA